MYFIIKRDSIINLLDETEPIGFFVVVYCDIVTENPWKVCHCHPFSTTTTNK